VGIDRRLVHRLIAQAARPCRGSTAVAETGWMTYSDFTAAEGR
jgi:hypothetical protein